jgi:DNA-binding transcriptional regulator LsrR (DeoR family)
VGGAAMETTNDRNVLLAAYYKAADPTLTQQAIGLRANLGTQAQVSRLLAEARQRGYLREVFEFPSHMPLDTRRQLEREFEQSFYPRHARLEAALIERAERLCETRSDGGSPFKRLHVVAAPGLSEGDDRAREEAFLTFGASAAEIVAKYIDDAESCCVAWGRTVDVTVRHIRSRTKPPDRKKVFMPIAGEPTNFEPNGVSPSDAASTLAAAWPESEHLSLRGVQARIPKSVYEHDEAGIAQQLASYSKSYQLMFGRQGRPLIERVAMILTGIGDVRTSKQAGGATKQGDPWYLETAEAEDPNVLRHAVGNIGGVWITRDDASPEESRKVEQVNERWLGAQHGDFRRCSLNADMGQRPGVVVLAVEPEKARIVLEALYLMNVLIVSRQLADALAAALELDLR